ncbi:FAD dependent oxidoreductase [Cordyceps fumosorosea ARSEF 2679]|uniref:sarcosine oxidasee (formaldehyde-forming) n=1 Tax=Cordyceps fumosorosea (strain ARSEF 2679) TaxID=1081104 RepID=A0A162I8Y7_CORFA|nr:FAD dependent oxidoreductase [Cordyceps fumosorosea ARSEF 2679]OAA53865.1 FAD dependent oxidoreductase [Cordyceps fumosorosea ARSEF 2679]
MATEYDVAVVGLGALGSAAAYHAALKGARVIAFEQFELGHVRGASHDTSRIIRTSYEAPQYVALAKSAYEDWAQLEAAAGQKLTTITGGLVFLPDGGPLSPEAFATSLGQNDIPYELLGAAEVRERWPQFGIGEEVRVVYTPDSGVAHAAKAVAAMQHLARAKGALLRELTPVTAITPPKDGGGVVVIETPGGTYAAKKVILATDAWTNELLGPLGVHIPLTVSQEQVTYFKPSDASAFDASLFPVWIWHADPCFYGFPAYGEPTIKAGQDCAMNPMTPKERTFVHSPKLLDDLRGFMDGLIPDGKRETLRTVTCQYTLTPGRQFVVAPLRRHPEVLVALGAAHAFKFAPAIGRNLAEMAVDGKSSDDLSKFGMPAGTEDD